MCRLMGDMFDVKWIYVLRCVECVVLLWPSIAGLAGADT